MTEPLPCPFCRAESREIDTDFDRSQGYKWGNAICISCGARGPEVQTRYDESPEAPWRERAIQEWNDRATSNEPTSEPLVTISKEEMPDQTHGIVASYDALACYEVGIWYPWIHGEQPVPYGTEVRVLGRYYGLVEFPQRAEELEWDNIIAFKVISYPKPPRNQDVIEINGKQIPAPMRQAPMQGTHYYFFDWMESDGVGSGIWEENRYSGSDWNALHYGIWDTYDGACQAAEAIRSLLMKDGE